MQTDFWNGEQLSQLTQEKQSFRPFQEELERDSAKFVQPSSWNGCHTPVPSQSRARAFAKTGRSEGKKFPLKSLKQANKKHGRFLAALTKSNSTLHALAEAVATLDVTLKEKAELSPIKKTRSFNRDYCSKKPLEKNLWKTTEPVGRLFSIGSRNFDKIG